jgi:hypothetical protein
MNLVIELLRESWNLLLEASVFIITGIDRSRRQ